MIIRICFTVAFGLVPLFAQNYADRQLELMAAEAETLLNRKAPIEKMLLGERIYFISHESSRQNDITELIEKLYDSCENQELKAELGFYLIQLNRQLGHPDEVARLVRELGYVSEWSILGPLTPDGDAAFPGILRKNKVAGLNREVKPHVARAYGASDYWGEGIGQYGFFSANHAVYPQQLAGALYSTWFQAPTKGAYRLGLGWSNKARVWINQTEVYKATEDQVPHPDQSALRFQLKKGWHRLTIYLEGAAENANLGFFARLTTAEGDPISCQAERRGRLPRKKPTEITLVESLADQAKKKSAYALASVLLIKEQLRGSRFDQPKDLLLQSIAQKPTRLVVEKLLSLTKDPNQKWQFLTEFVKATDGADSESLNRAWAFTQLGQIALGQKRFWEARHFAERAMAAHSGYWPAAVLQNNVFSALGLNGEALRHTLALDKTYPGVPWIMMDLCDLYWAMDFRAENSTQIDKVLQVRKASSKFSERKILTLKNQGDTQALETFYESMIRDAPYSVATLRAYATFLIVNERYEKADTLLSGALAQLPSNPDLLQAMGELKMRSGDDDALGFLERSLALRPQNPALERLINLSKSEQEAFYDPYRITTAPDVFVREFSPVVINIDNTVRKVAPNGQSSVYHQLEYEIMDEQGVQELPGYSFSYAPLREKARLLRAEIERDGKIIHLTDSSRSRISDPAYRMYYDLVSYQIPFPTTQPGDIIRIEYRVDDIHGSNIFGDYFGDLQYFSSRYPTKRLAYTAIVPKSMDVHYHVEKMNPEFFQKETDDIRVLSWALNQISPYETESRMPGLAGYLPYVALSTFNDWQSMARWYSELIKNQLILDVETKGTVQQLIQGESDRLEIVKKIHEYVITNTRYVALEFGIHGYKPYQVNQVCTRQFGDCKDKASLIVAMLWEAGIDAQVAIVRTSDKGYVHTFPAMLSYFNHAIAYVPEFDLYLDGTAEFSGIEELPAMDQGALTLIVDKDGTGKLTKIPIKDNNHQGYAFKLNLKADGAADISGELSYRGVVTPGVRQHLAIDTKLSRNLQELMADTVPGLNVLEADREGTRINDPIRLTFKGVSNQLFQMGNGEVKLPLSILNSQLTQSYTPNATRRYPIEFGVPKSKTVEIKIDAPEGYILGRIPDSLEVEDDNFLARITIDKRNARQVWVNYQVTFKTPRVEPDDYSALRDMMQAHDRLLDQSIYFVAQ